MYKYTTGSGQIWVGNKLPPPTGHNMIWLKPSGNKLTLWEIRAYNIYKEEWQVITSDASASEELLKMILALAERINILENSAVLYTKEQNLTEEEKALARSNIGASSGSDPTTIKVVQGPGQSTEFVMSQKAVTDQLFNKANTADVYTKDQLYNKDQTYPKENVYSKVEIDKILENMPTEASESLYTRARTTNLMFKIKLSGLQSQLTDLNIAVAPLKYNKSAVISFTTDDCHASTLSNIWAAINKRPQTHHSSTSPDGKGYTYHANQYLIGDIPTAILYQTYNDYLTYTDNFGGRRRFKQGVAIWPYCGNNNGFFMDQVQPADPTIQNLYRFMSPYLTYGDCNLLKKYGVDFYFHNTGVEEYGNDKIVTNVITGLNADRVKFKKEVGFTSKVLARPDGNNIFIDAMTENPRIDFAVGENTPAVDMIPYNTIDMYHNTYMRMFKDDYSLLKSSIQELMAKPIEQRNWFHFCCHTATPAWDDMLKWIYDNYNTDIWFATAGELYEYQYFKKYIVFKSISQKTNTDGTIEILFELRLPWKENFQYKDVTLNIKSADSFPSSSSIESIECTNADVPELLYKIDNSNNRLVLHIGINDSAIENAEFFTSKYEVTKDSIWRSDAELEIERLRADLRATYQKRLDAVRDVPITSITLSGDTIVNKGATIQVAATALPADNTDMNLIDLIFTQELFFEKVSKIINNNVCTFTLKALESGTSSITATCNGIQSNILNVTITDNVVPATGISLLFDKSELNTGDTVNFIAAVTPSNTTQMDEVVVTVNSPYTISNKQVVGNEVRGSILASVAGTITATGTVGNFTSSASAVVSEIVVPYIEISDLAVTNIGVINVGDTVNLSYNTNIGSQTPIDYKVWSNLSDEASAPWTPIIGGTAPSISALEGMTTLYFKVRSTSTVISNTLNVSVAVVVPTEENDKIICFANRSWTQYPQISYVDTTYGGTTNYCTPVDIVAAIPKTIYAKSGKLLSEFTPMTDAEKKAISWVDTTNFKTWQTSPGQTGDMAPNFSWVEDKGLPIDYRYANEYGKITACIFGMKCPNGTYQVRLLSCSAEADMYSNAEIKFNNTIVLFENRNTSYQENHTWTEWITVEVTDGILAFQFKTEPRKRAGFNAAEIKLP